MYLFSNKLILYQSLENVPFFRAIFDRFSTEKYFFLSKFANLWTDTIGAVYSNILTHIQTQVNYDNFFFNCFIGQNLCILQMTHVLATSHVSTARAVDSKAYTKESTKLRL